MLERMEYVLEKIDRCAIVLITEIQYMYDLYYVRVPDRYTRYYLCQLCTLRLILAFPSGQVYLVPHELAVSVHFLCYSFRNFFSLL